MTAKEKQFCTHYFNLDTPYIAAKKAGFDENGAKGADKLLQRQDVREYILSLEQKGDVMSLSKAAVRGLGRLALSQPQDVNSLFEGEGDMYCVSEIKKSEKGTVEIKFFDRIRALTSLYEIAKSIDESASVPFFEALAHVGESEDESGG
jgi:phage terminase small subunit